jgi:mRNA interferase RelE/StbE
MNKYTVALSKSVEKQLDKLPDKVVSQIIDILQTLSNEPRPHGCKKLINRPGYRVRKGDYRIVYDIYDKVLIIEIISIGNRRDVYD